MSLIIERKDEYTIMMRGIYSSVTDIRRKVFTEVARLAYEGGDYSRIEELPYKIIPGEEASYRDSIFLERAIVGERLRLAIGLPLRPVAEHARLSEGIEESAIDTLTNFQSVHFNEIDKKAKTKVLRNGYKIQS